MNPYECAYKAFRDAGFSTFPAKQIDVYVQLELFKQVTRDHPDLSDEEKAERLHWAKDWQQAVLDRVKWDQKLKGRRSKRRIKKHWVVAAS